MINVPTIFWILGVSLCTGPWTYMARAQGTVLLYNYDSPYMDAPVYGSDRVTAVFGPQFTAALLAGPSSNSMSQVAIANFIRPGYYFNGIQTISTVPPGSTAWIQVEVWNTQSGASFAQAQASSLPDSWLASSVFTVATGGGAGGTIPAAALLGLGTSPVFLNGAVPEPSSLALCMLAGVMAIVRFWVFGETKMMNAKILSMALVAAGHCAACYSQGTVSFANYSNPGSGVNAPVYQSDGVTKLSGSQFMAALLEGPTASNLSTVASTGFLTGNGAGHFDGGSITLPGVSVTATVWVQVDVWNTSSGASFVQAQSSNLPNSWWQSSAFTVVTGGGAVNPFPPAALTGLGTSPVFLNAAVPEPSSLALWIVAGVLATIRFRRVGTKI